MSAVPNITEVASQSHCKFRIAALGFDWRGNFIGKATNKPRFMKKGGGIHAEMALLSKCGPRLKTIILCRIGNGGDFRPIEPCDNCARVLSKKGIKVKTISNVEDIDKIN